MHWVVLALITVHGVNLRAEVGTAKNLADCKIKAAQVYTHIAGPVFCERISQADLIDVYGNARLVFRSK